MGHRGHLSVLMTFFHCQTINSINLHNLTQSSGKTMAFLWVRMNGLPLKSMLGQSLHYLTNVFNWILMPACLFLELRGPVR